MLRTDSANNITITQGNSAEIDVTAYDEEGNPIELQEGDKVIFKVECNGKEIIKKVLTSENFDSEEKALKLILKPEDTINLPLEKHITPSGGSYYDTSYYYDCLYIFADGSAYTFIDAAQFKIVKAIAKVGDDP